MRILHIPNYYFPHVGGIEQTARDMVTVLSRREGISQKVICMNEGVDETACDTVDGIEVIRCASTLKLSSQSVSADLKKELEKLFEDYQPDVTVLHWPNPFNAFYLLHILKQYDRKEGGKHIRLIVYWHSDIIKQKILGKLLDGITLALARRADEIIATSPNYIEGSRYLKANRDKCRVIPSCIREDRLQITSERKQLIDEIRSRYKGNILCFSFGRNVPYKGFEYLDRAAQLLPGGISVVRKEGLSEDELVAYLAACDIFCFPSITRNEAFGLGLAEGMYFGHPAVTFNIPGSGVNYVSLDGVTGVECPNRDAVEYAKAIIRLSADDRLREKLGNEARQRVLENFTYDKYTAHVNNLADGWGTKESSEYSEGNR